MASLYQQLPPLAHVSPYVRQLKHAVSVTLP